MGFRARRRPRAPYYNVTERRETAAESRNIVIGGAGARNTTACTDFVQEITELDIIFHAIFLAGGAPGQPGRARPRAENASE